MKIFENRNIFNGLIFKFFSAASFQIIGKLLLISISVFLARMLSPENYGIYSLIISFISILSLPAIAGLPKLLVREVATLHIKKKHSELKGLLIWSNRYILIISMIIFIFLFLTKKSQIITFSIDDYIYIISLCLFLKSVISRQSAILNGLNFPVLSQFTLFVIGNFFTLLILIILKLIDIEINIMTAVLAYGSGLFISFVFGFIILKTKNKELLLQAVPIFKIKKWHKSLIPLTLLTIVTTLNLEVATLVLGMLGSNESIAYFKVSTQIITILSIGLAAMNVIIGPILARYVAENNESEIQKTLKSSVRIATIIYIPIIFIIVFFRTEIIVLLFGDEYVRSSKLIIILLLGQTLNVLVGSVGLVLQMTHNESIILKNLCISFILNLILMLVLIPIYNDIGAAISLTISECIINLLLCREVYIKLGYKTWIN